MKFILFNYIHRKEELQHLIIWYLKTYDILEEPRWTLFITKLHDLFVYNLMLMFRKKEQSYKNWRSIQTKLLNDWAPCKPCPLYKECQTFEFNFLFTTIFLSPSLLQHLIDYQTFLDFLVQKKTAECFLFFLFFIYFLNTWMIPTMFSFFHCMECRVWLSSTATARLLWPAELLPRGRHGSP